MRRAPSPPSADLYFECVRYSYRRASLTRVGIFPAGNIRKRLTKPRHDHKQIYQQGADDDTSTGPHRPPFEGGEEIAYHINGDRVFLTRAATDSPEDPFGAFSEWLSDADRRAYADL